MGDFGLNALKNKKIYVYGLGINAKYICESVLHDDINGLIALENVGGEKYGFNIFSLDDAIKDSEIIIIAASKEVTKIIYERIKYSVPQSIPIYNMQGIVLNSAEAYRDNIYWNNNVQNLKREIEQHDVISFDCFDTLIMRQCLEPTDLFILVEKKLKDKGYDYPLADWRINAEINVSRKKQFYGFDDIYQEIKDEQSISDNELNFIKKCELDMEKEVTCQRKVIVDMLSFAIQNNKKVYILSDMYLSSDFIAKLLHKAGVEENIIIWVSCEQTGSKSDGSLYKKLLLREKGKSILHIGDNFKSDCLCAENAGIDSYFILSGKSLLEASSVSYLLDRVFSYSDKLLLGVMVSYLFNDPFGLSGSKGKLQFKDISTFSKSCFSAVTLSYLSYIIKQVLGRTKSKLLFVSRDGFFLQQLYNKTKMIYMDLELPDSVYFYSSRVAATGACCRSREDIKVLLSDIEPNSNANLKKILDKRLHVNFDSSFDVPVSEAIQKWGSENLILHVLKYEEKIYQEAKRKIQNYKRYLTKIGIEAGDELVLVDLVSRGTVRYALHRITGLPVHLIVMGGLGIPNSYCRDISDVSMQYGSISRLSELDDLFGFLEIVYASHEGQLDSFDSEGNALFVPGTEYNELLITELQKGLSDMYETLLKLISNIWDLDLSYDFSVSCMQMLYSQYSDIDDEIKDKFIFYDPLAKEQKTNLLRDRV